MPKLSSAVRHLWILTVYTFTAASVNATPLIFNATESAAPGNVIYLQGDNFTTNPQVWFHRVLPTDTTLTPDTQMTILTQSTQAITAQLPTYIPLGLYAVWVKDAAGNLSAPTLINKARAMQLEYPEISPGYTFRIFGRNLLLPNSTPTVTFVNGGTSLAATVVTAYANNSYVIQVTAPAGVVAGTTYTINVSNGYGHNASANFDVSPSDVTILGRTGGADPFNLGVPWGPDFAAIAANVINVVTSTNPHTGLSYGADNTGITNSYSIIAQALTDAGNATLYPNGATVYLPTGTYAIDKGATVVGFNIPSKVVLKGDGIGQTIINDTSSALTNYNWFLTFAYITPNNGTLSGATGFTYNQTAPGLSVTTASPPGIRNYANSSSEMFLDHIQVNGAYATFSSTQLTCGQFIPQAGNLNKILMQNCDLHHIRFGTANLPGSGTYGSNYIFRNNNIVSYFARLEFAYIEPLLIEGNHFTRDGNFPPSTYTPGITGGGIDPTHPNALVINNTLDAINLPIIKHNDGESILNQNASYYDFHQPTGVTPTVLTDSSRTWTTNQYAGEILAIVNGPGMGQRRKIVSNTANTVTTSLAWTENPTTSSTYSITHPGADRWLVMGNQLFDLPRGIVFYTGGYDSVVANNSLHDVGETIYISSGQRTYSNSSGTWLGRMDLNWKDLIADNIAVNTKGTWANTTTANYNGNAYGGNAVAGTVFLGTEFRRNVLQANATNLKDNDIGEWEGNNNQGFIMAGTTFTETGIPAMLGTVFEDNSAISTSNSYFVNTDTYQTTIWNQLNMNVATEVLDTYLNGAAHASVNTIVGIDSSFFEANLSGTGTNTGGATDLIDTGALGLLYAGTGSCHAAISSSNTFTTTSGSYLECSISGSGTTGHLQSTPTTTRTSWGRIFDNRTGKWLVNGGFDFFWRPLQIPTSGNAMRPIDLTNGAGGIRLVMANGSPTLLIFQVITGTGGGGVNLNSTYSAGFAANTIYHIGVTFSTNATTGVTTEKVFCVAGTGPITTSTTTNQIGTSTFTLSPTVVTNTTGYLSAGPWFFGDAYGNGTLNTNDYDGLKMYSQDPGTFPGL